MIVQIKTVHIAICTVFSFEKKIIIFFFFFFLILFLHQKLLVNLVKTLSSPPFYKLVYLKYFKIVVIYEKV